MKNERLESKISESEISEKEEKKVIEIFFSTQSVLMRKAK
jgi:hypothetical protein